MDINKYIKEAHSVARSKGFWDKPRTLGSLVMLTITELSEAVDADRKGHYADLDYFRERLKETSESTNGNLNYEIQLRHRSESFKKSFEHHVKDSVDDEIADSLIRLFDLMGGNNLKYVEPDSEYKALMKSSMINESPFVEDIMYITSMISKVYEADVVDEPGLMCTYLNNTCYLLTLLAEKMNIDLEAHVVYKMKYNGMREMLNGKAY